MRLLFLYGPMLAVAALIVAAFLVRLRQAQARGTGGRSRTIVYVKCPGCGQQVLVSSPGDPSAEAPRGQNPRERICQNCKTAVSVPAPPR